MNAQIRGKMFNLRMTWNEVFSNAILYALDVKTNTLDSGWPITAKVTPRQNHANPDVSPDSDAILWDKQCELLELENRKLELELAVSKRRMAEQEMQIKAKVSLATFINSIAKL